jgi:hypothetical protein
MKAFWTENKWYILSVMAALVIAMAYIVFSAGPSNLLPEVYSVM